MLATLVALLGCGAGGARVDGAAITVAPDAGGTGGDGAVTGGTIGSGGTGGEMTAAPDAALGNAAADAAPTGVDGPAAVQDAPVSDASERRDGFAGAIPDGQPWQRACPEGASRADCCDLYCACMVQHCQATLPRDCQAACAAAQNWDLPCRTYQCFATQNPSFPQDMASHCKHAVGQLGKCGNR